MRDERRVQAPRSYNKRDKYRRGCNWCQPDREDHAVHCVTRDKAVAFATRAEARLSTEAEWEYAARSGGTPARYARGDQAPTCSRTVMRVGGNSTSGCGRKATWPVCSKPEGTSAQGVCDLSGNVWEWVQDGFHDSYTGAPTDGSAWEAGATDRVYRGGGWTSNDLVLSATVRLGMKPSLDSDSTGFRLARSAP